MQIDQYGFEAASMFFQRRQLQPYRIAEDGEATYICFADTPERCIHRVTQTDGETVIEWAFGAWSERSSLDYIPINQTRNV